MIAKQKGGKKKKKSEKGSEKGSSLLFTFIHLIL